MTIDLTKREAAFIYFILENLTAFDGLDKQTLSVVRSLVSSIQANLRSHGIDEKTSF